MKEAAMITRCSLHLSDRAVRAGVAALALLVSMSTSAAGETTHEANQAAAGIAATALATRPSTLTAPEVLNLVTDDDGTIRFDIAEDGTRLLRADAPVLAAGLRAQGAPYRSQGYIYPEGTLSAQVDGVNADGSPQFPERVLGQWSAYGWSVGDDTYGTAGPWLLSTQIYQFGNEWGAATLVSEGFVHADPGGTVARAITGGTGPFAIARGELVDTTLGAQRHRGQQCPRRDPSHGQHESHAVNHPRIAGAGRHGRGLHRPHPCHTTPDGNSSDRHRLKEGSPWIQPRVEIGSRGARQGPTTRSPPAASSPPH